MIHPSDGASSRLPSTARTREAAPAPHAALEPNALPALVGFQAGALAPLNAEAEARLATGGTALGAALREVAAEVHATGGRASRRLDSASVGARQEDSVSAPPWGESAPVELVLACGTRTGAQLVLLSLAWRFDPTGLERLAPGLTRREREVASWAVQGLGPTHIAEQLGVRWHTARTHLRNVRRALGVSEQLDLLRLGRAMLVPVVLDWTSPRRAGEGPTPT